MVKHRSSMAEGPGQRRVVPIAVVRKHREKGGARRETQPSRPRPRGCRSPGPTGAAGHCVSPRIQPKGHQHWFPCSPFPWACLPALPSHGHSSVCIQPWCLFCTWMSSALEDSSQTGSGPREPHFKHVASLKVCLQNVDTRG